MRDNKPISIVTEQNKNKTEQPYSCLPVLTNGRKISALETLGKEMTEKSLQRTTLPHPPIFVIIAKPLALSQSTEQLASLERDICQI